MLVDVVMKEEAGEAWVCVDGEGHVYDLPAVRPYLPPELRRAKYLRFIPGRAVDRGASVWEEVWVFSLTERDENASVTRRTCERQARRPRNSRLCGIR